MTTFYKCDICGQEFINENTCSIHEFSHTQNNNKELVQIILDKGENPCNFCDYSYYVYNCEIECGCSFPCFNYKKFFPVALLHNKTP